MSGPIQLRHEGIKIKLAWLLIAAVVAGLAKGLWWLARHPVGTLTLGLLTAVGAGFVVLGPVSMAGILAGVAVLLAGWRLVHARSFRPVVAWPLRAVWRRYTVYRPQWAALMRNLELSFGEEKDGGNEEVPALVSVSCTATVDRVRLSTLPGHVLADYAQYADRFAACFEAVDARVRSVTRPTPALMLRRLARRVPGLAARLGPAPSTRVRKRLIELRLLRSDPLAVPVPLLEVPSVEGLDLARVPVAHTEDGLPWLLRLIATHTLLIGATGAGKGSVLWSIVRALGEALRTRLVELWVIGRAHV